jgi:sulfur-oxidizing protein SoxX
MHHRIAGIVGAALIALPGSAWSAEPGPPAVASYAVAGDAIPKPLTDRPGDAGHGRAIAADRQTGLCVLCHAGPFADERFAGNVGPDLAGVGTRLTEGQLRLRVVDNRRINPRTSMPSFHRTEGLVRVGAAWRGNPVLTAQQVEDVVAYLQTLRESRPPR